jgi:hypothetical protein
MSDDTGGFCLAITQTLRPLFYSSGMNSYPRRSISIIWARTGLVITGTALAVTLAGCAPAATGSGVSSTPAAGSSASSGGSADSTSKEIDACSLLSASDASSLVGETLSTGVSSTIATGQDQCKYGSSGADIGLNVIIYHGDAAPSYALVISATGANHPVSGVGEKADDDGSIELDVELANQNVIAVQYEQAAGRLAVAKALVAALK